MTRFAGKIALVTGSGRGIGRGIALRLAQEGADLVINDRPQSEYAQEVVAEITALGRRALFVAADVGERPAMEQLFAEAVAQYGRLDIVVANAGLSYREPFIEQPWEKTLRTLEVCQFGVSHACQLAAQQMVRQGHGGKIVIIGSVHYDMAFANSAAYNMAKAAVNHLGRTLAVELAPHRINVNVVNPGWIDTPGERNFTSEDEMQRSGRRIPWGRLGKPEDIAKAAAFLCSEDAEYITGAALRVDGGFVPGLVLPPLDD